MRPLPRTVEEVCEGWLAEVLAERHRGTIVDTVELGDVMAGSATKVRLAVGYEANPSDLPGTFVLKAGFDPVMRALALDLYRNEVAFFAEIAPTLDLRLVRCYHAAADEVQAAVLLEDLAARGATFGDMETPLAPEVARDAIAQLARLHARYWRTTDVPEIAALGGLAAGGQRLVAEHLLSPDSWRRCEDLGRFDGLPASVTARERVAAAILGLLDEPSDQPSVLVHGDAHLGNLWFDEEGRPGWLDWQAVGPGSWDADVAYFLVGALDPIQRRACERDLLAAYADELRRAGVADPPEPDALWAAYLRRLPYGMLGLLCTPEMQPEGFCRAMGGRFATAIEDHGVL